MLNSDLVRASVRLNSGNGVVPCLQATAVIVPLAFFSVDQMLAFCTLKLFCI